MDSIFFKALETIVSPPTPIHWEELFLRFFLAMGLGFGVMFIHRVGRRGEPRNHSFEITLVLLAVLIAVVTRVIGDSVARAFSLVGALSIVRFRTVVRDTQDTAYVIFAVVVGMAAGANLVAVGVAGMMVIFVAILILTARRGGGSRAGDQACMLNLRVALGPVLDQLKDSLFPRYLKAHQLVSLATAQKGMALEASYVVSLQAGGSATELVRELNKVEGVQNVQFLTPDAVPEK